MWLLLQLLYRISFMIRKYAAQQSNVSQGKGSVQIPPHKIGTAEFSRILPPKVTVGLGAVFIRGLTQVLGIYYI